MATRVHIQKVLQNARYDIPASLAREIGRFIVAWAHFEHLVQSAIWAQLELTPAEGRLVVRDPRISDRLDMLRDIGQLKELAGDYVLLLSIRKRVAPLATMRHLLAHGLWGAVGPDWCVQLTRGTWPEIPEYPQGLRSTTPEGITVTVSDLRTWTQQTGELISDLKRLGAQYTVVPKPSPRKPRQRSAHRGPTRGHSESKR